MIEAMPIRKRSFVIESDCDNEEVDFKRQKTATEDAEAMFPREVACKTCDIDDDGTVSSASSVSESCQQVSHTPSIKENQTASPTSLSSSVSVDSLLNHLPKGRPLMAPPTLPRLGPGQSVSRRTQQ
eukprot:Nitzschia sp. Nitz4//scaffold18_size181773//96276//96656//NITZ4_001921-RA/size181773-processed-gene-0.22-mRNA-1//1//CDS//3329540029//8202//frame0